MTGKILITGATGFVGFHLTKAALGAGLEVYAVVRKSSSVSQFSGLPVRFAEVDLFDKHAVDAFFAEHKFDYVVHAAGLTRAPNASVYQKTNVEVTANLAESAVKYPVKKFVFLSSLAALGPLEYENPELIGEHQKPAPVTEYGRSKMLAEAWLQQHCTELPLVILRPTAVYGPREKDIFLMFKTLNRGLEPYIGRKGQWLSFIYVKDLAEVVLRALAVDTGRAVYNVADGNAYDRYALACISKTILKKKTLRFHVPHGIVQLIASGLELMSGKNTVPTLNKEKLNELTAGSWKCDIQKLKQELGFVPRYDLKAGLQETLSWYKEQKWL